MQTCASTLLAQNISREDIIIPVVSVERLFGNDLSSVVERTYSRSYLLSRDTITITADGLGRTVTTPEWWRDNDITVTLDGVPTTDFTRENFRVTLDLPPAAGVIIEIVVTIQGITFPPLAAPPNVFLNGTQWVLDTDYTLTQSPSGTRIEFITAPALGDSVSVTLTYKNATENVAWIGNERIEFYGVDLERNLLLQCIRGTRATAAQEHEIGTRVWEGGDRQSLLETARDGRAGFSEDDVRQWPWNDTIELWLAEECPQPVQCAPIECRTEPEDQLQS